MPINTHTLEEFVNTEFNSPWEEFALVMEMVDKQVGQRLGWIRVQRPLAIYVPPLTMQLWQSGRSRARINRIHARHPGIALDILKQYKLIYEWIEGKNLIEIFEQTKLELPDIVHHLKSMQKKAFDDLSTKGYHMADMKPEHVIVDAEDCVRIEQLGGNGDRDAAQKQVDQVYRLLNVGKYSVIDYELLFRTPEHEDRVKASRRHSYLDDMRDRLSPTPLPSYLTRTEILGVPYILFPLAALTLAALTAWSLHRCLSNSTDAVSGEFAAGCWRLPELFGLWQVCYLSAFSGEVHPCVQSRESPSY